MSSSGDERITDEVQALEAILLKDVVVKRVGDVPKYIIETIIHPLTGDNIDQQYVCVTLEVGLSSGYPDTSPEVALKNPRGLDDMILDTINTHIQDKLKNNLGQPIVFELIGIVRDHLTKSNLPRGQCVICLYDFVDGDLFIKTQCYHYFHNHCLANHFIAGKKYYHEELEKLPTWQQMQVPPYQQTCPVCRCTVSCDVDTLKEAPPPKSSLSAPPFRLTAELKELQMKMAELLAVQVAKGGVVGMGDNGPPLLTITTTPTTDNASRNNVAGSSRDAQPGAGAGGARHSGGDAAAADTQPRPPYRGPYRYH